MNPVVFQKLLRYSAYPIKNAGLLLRKSTFYRRAFSTLSLARSRPSNIRIVTERNMLHALPNLSRSFSTAAESSSNTSVYVAGAIATLVIGGGIYYHSNNLKNSALCKEAISLLNRCSLVREVLGSPIKSISLARGSVKKEKAHVTFIIRGSNGDYLVSLKGTTIDNDLVVENLFFHKRSQVPVYDYYIVSDGELVAKLDDEELEVPEEAVEVREEPDVSECFEEKKL